MASPELDNLVGLDLLEVEPPTREEFEALIEWRVLAKCHEQRNRMEYEGPEEVDGRLLQDVIAAGDDLLAAVPQLSGFESL